MTSLCNKRDSQTYTRHYTYQSINQPEIKPVYFIPKCWPKCDQLLTKKPSLQYFHKDTPNVNLHGWILQLLGDHIKCIPTASKQILPQFHYCINTTRKPQLTLVHLMSIKCSPNTYLSSFLVCTTRSAESQM